MGVTLMRTSDEEKVVAIAKISGGSEEKEEQLTLQEENISDEIDNLNTDVENEIDVTEDLNDIE